MKKIALLMGLLLLTGCDPDTTKGTMVTTNGESVCADVRLYTIEFNGEQHEYVYFHSDGGNCAVGSLSHWAGCKYCKGGQEHE